jgi:hypothetical protein
MKLIQSLARHVDSSLKQQSDPQNAGRIHQCPKKPCRASDVSFSRWLQPKSVLQITFSWESLAFRGGLSY